MKLYKTIIVHILVFFVFTSMYTQSFYFGADLSYVNEMEDCGGIYTESNQVKDPYTIFSDHNTNLVRLRLWHTPRWYDELNSGKRYSDYDDVKKSIERAKSNGMQVLLDFHLSDSWADPSKQLVPEAWLPVVDNTQLLKDSLYSYIYTTLDKLSEEGLLPEMVQIGNETNRGILLSPEDNAQWTLEWERNATLFNSAIKAVRDIEQEKNKPIEVVVHLAGPADVEWYVDEFVQNGIVDFDIIGISYYWSWHRPTSIEDTGDVIDRLKVKYPEKEVLIVETGYIWTLESADSANNIINNVNADYGTPSPESQRDWLIDLTQEVINSDGLGVVYWEPGWISTDCNTLWGMGSHQENATFFDFNNNLLIPGGIQWTEYPYANLTSNIELQKDEIHARLNNDTLVFIDSSDILNATKQLIILNISGQQVLSMGTNFSSPIDVSHLPAGKYFIKLLQSNGNQISTTVVKF